MNGFNRRGGQFLFLNLGHLYSHLFMLLYATAVVAMVADSAFQGSYGFLLALSTASFVAFGAGSLPASWLGDKWSRHGMMTVFFIGIGVSSILTGLAGGPVSVAICLFAIGIFASIYHPVGIAMVAENSRSLGKELGINGVFGNLGVAMAAIVAGTLTDLISWRAAFIIPGVVSILTGIAYLVFSRNAPAPHARARTDTFIGATRTEARRAIAVVILASVPGTLIFNATTNVLPKVFEERLGALAPSLSQVGMWVFVVFVVASIAQVLTGMLLDRYRLKPIYVVAVIFQVPTICFVAYAHHLGMLGAAAAMMFVVFSIIPIHDTLIARFTVQEYRSRIFALKYLAGLCAGTAALPLVGWLHADRGGFEAVFLVLAAFAICEALISLCLPTRDPLSQMTPGCTDRKQ